MAAIYRRTANDRLICRHGPILYGTSCLGCERESETEHGQSRQREWARTWDRETADAFAYQGAWRYHQRGDPRPRSGHWSGTYSRQPIEIITDPDDPRGLNAKRVGPAYAG